MCQEVCGSYLEPNRHLWNLGQVPDSRKSFVHGGQLDMVISCCSYLLSLFRDKSLHATSCAYSVVISQVEQKNLNIASVPHYWGIKKWSSSVPLAPESSHSLLYSVSLSLFLSFFVVVRSSLFNSLFSSSSNCYLFTHTHTRTHMYFFSLKEVTSMFAYVNAILNFVF